MNENQIEAITKGLVEASKMGTVNALTYVQKGLEAYKKVEVPITTNKGTVWTPYLEDKEVKAFIDFMLIYLDEVIKSLDKQIEVKENE